MSETNSGNIANVQALRGCAALLVAFGHGLRAGTVPHPLLVVVSSFAYAGVDIFFVISGFIVSEAAARAAQSAPRPRASLNFAARRVFRIFPLYWIVLAVAIGLGGFIHIAPLGWPKSSFISMALLTTIWITPLSSAWTLAFEAYFYVVLTVIILFAGRRVQSGILVWLFLQAAWIGFRPSDPWSPASNCLVSEFAFGWLVGRLRAKGSHRAALLSAIGALALWIVGAMLTAHHGLLMPRPRVETFGVGSAFLIYALLVMERSGWRAPNILQRLGDVSYSTYLWHMIIFGAVYAMFGLSGWSFAVSMIVIIGWSFVSYILIEKPAIRCGHFLSTSPRDGATAS